MEQEKYTFIDVCQQDFDGIEIPIIQRDYAQGREKEEKKRNRFLKALLKSVNSDKGITLDFVYGSVIDKKLVPLDGQQRLTTLFLLHWYAAKRENIPAGQWEVLKKFSYATRPSARRFCEQLLAYVPDFDTKKYLSEQICNEAWFPMAWNDDPTVEGMLRMLDAIHHAFAETTHLWKALTEDRKITFYFKKLEDMDITDDIYIKMNSRGKPLTDFEHFKAEFTETIRETIGNDTISHKIDVAWTNMLWPYRSSNNIIDEVFNAYLSGEDYETGKVKVYDKQTNLFKDCCKNYTGVGTRGSFGFNKMLILYAFIVWKTKATNITDSDFARRIRIVRNLVWNSTDEIRLERMKNLLEEVEEIVINASLTEESNGFNIRQKREEIEKIDWCNKNPNLTEKLFELEDHWTLCGCIAAVGLSNPENFDSFRALFDNDLLLVSKTLLSYGDYSQNLRNSKWIVAHEAKSWQDSLHPSKQRDGFDKIQSCLNALLADFENGITEKSLENKVQTYLNDANTPKDWRYYFVKYPILFEKAIESRYVWKEEGDYVFNVLKKSIERTYWSGLLLAVKKECKKQNIEVSWEEGNNKLIINALCEKLVSHQDYFEIQNEKGDNVQNIPISQNEEIDTEDRVEKALELIRTYQEDRIDH